MKTISTYFLLVICFLFASVSGTTHATIRAVVFDFNGVIVKNDRQMVIDSIAQALELPQEEIERAYIEMKKQKVKGEKNQIRFWTQFAQSKGKKLPEQWIAQYRQVKLGATKEIPGMLDIVRNLQKKDIATGLLTNASKESIFLRKNWAYSNSLNLLSLQIKSGIKKPDPKSSNCFWNGFTWLLKKFYTSTMTKMLWRPLRKSAWTRSSSKMPLKSPKNSKIEALPLISLQQFSPVNSHERQFCVIRKNITGWQDGQDKRNRSNLILRLQ